MCQCVTVCVSVVRGNLWDKTVVSFYHTHLESPGHPQCFLITESLCAVLSHSVVSDPMDCIPPGSSAHGDSPGKNTGVGCHTLLRGSSQPRDRTRSPALQADSSRLSHQGTMRSFIVCPSNSSEAARNTIQSFLSSFKWELLDWITSSCKYLTKGSEFLVKTRLTLSLFTQDRKGRGRQRRKEGERKGGRK